MQITSSVAQNLSSERSFIAGREVRESLDAQIGDQRIQIQRQERVEVVAVSKEQLHLAADTPKVGKQDLDAARQHFDQPRSSESLQSPDNSTSYTLAPDEASLHKLRMLLVVLGHQAKDIDKQLERLLGLGSLSLPQNSADSAAVAQTPTQPVVDGGADEFLSYSYNASEWRGEALNVQASGTIKTADGREVTYGFSLEMLNVQYSYQQVNMNVGTMKDPLVLNLGGGPVQLDAAKKMSFDLDADGRREQVASLTGSSAYLALDRNGNGKIDDGRELFGALSGDGFADLAKYDEDGNGFIDEGDSVFEQLKLWRGEGQLMSLQEAGVGAIGLSRLAGQFDLISQQQLAGQVRSTGLFFFESGQVGSVQQIDLAV